jgi:hypothetical protein
MKLSNIQFHKNSFHFSRVFTCGKKEKHADAFLQIFVVNAREISVFLPVIIINPQTYKYVRIKFQYLKFYRRIKGSRSSSFDIAIG